MTTRRSFLRGLFAAPFIAKAEWLMPVKVAPLPYMPGDLIDFGVGMWQEIGWYAVCEPLFHGLPGNRVDNPSMQHRLIRAPGRLGLSYPEDIRG